MRRLEEQNHYEVLEVARSAERPEIEQAYRVLQATYCSDSLALYSLFDDADASALQERIEMAHRVLSNADARRAYDAEIGLAGWEQGSQLRGSQGSDELAELGEQSESNGLSGPDGSFGRDPSAEPLTRAESSESPKWAACSGGVSQRLPDEADADTASEVVVRGSDPLRFHPSELARSIEGFQDLEGDAEVGEDFDGPRLRRARLQRGIELDQIANVTKISTIFLGAIEQEAFDELPAPVYVRGFVIAYAQAIGLDPKSVAKSYMARLDDSSGGRRRIRLLGRRQESVR